MRPVGRPAHATLVGWSLCGVLVAESHVLGVHVAVVDERVPSLQVGWSLSV